MSHGEFIDILSRIKALSPEQMRQLRDELDSEIATSEAGRAAGGPPDALPAWKQVLDNMKDLADDEFDRMPADSSEQLDHYIYGTPKRPRS